MASLDTASGADEGLSRFAAARTIVVKIGSALLVNAETGDLRRDWLSGLAADVADLRRRGADVVIVTSGSIALGRVDARSKPGRRGGRPDPAGPRL